MELDIDKNHLQDAVNKSPGNLNFWTFFVFPCSAHILSSRHLYRRLSRDLILVKTSKTAKILRYRLLGLVRNGHYKGISTTAKIEDRPKYVFRRISPVFKVPKLKSS